MTKDIFSNQTLQELTDCLLLLFFFLVYLNVANDAKSYSAKKYYLPKGIINKHNGIVNGKNAFIKDGKLLKKQELS